MPRELPDRRPHARDRGRQQPGYCAAERPGERLACCAGAVRWLLRGSCGAVCAAGSPAGRLRRLRQSAHRPGANGDQHEQDENQFAEHRHEDTRIATARETSRKFRNARTCISRMQPSANSSLYKHIHLIKADRNQTMCYVNFFAVLLPPTWIYLGCLFSSAYRCPIKRSELVPTSGTYEAE